MRDAITIIAVIVFVAAIPEVLEGIAERVRDLFGKGYDSEKEP